MVNKQFDTIRERGAFSKFSVVEPDGHYVVPKSGYSRKDDWISNRIWNTELNSKTISKGLTTW